MGDFSDDESWLKSPERKKEVDTSLPKDKPMAPEMKEALIPSWKKEEVVAPPIHTDLVPVWEEIVTMGLETAERDALIEGLPRIGNCPFLKPLS